MSMLNEKSTLSDEIVSFLLSMRSTHIRHQLLWERIKNREGVNKNNFSQNISRLKKKGIISSDDLGISVVSKSLGKYERYKYIHKKPLKNNKLILIFDIPEKDRKVRGWLRSQIKLWEFTMIQKSVWLGSGPLPEEFYKKIKFLGIEKNIKIFNIRSSKDLNTK